MNINEKSRFYCGHIYQNNNVENPHIIIDLVMPVIAFDFDDNNEWCCVTPVGLVEVDSHVVIYDSLDDRVIYNDDYTYTTGEEVAAVLKALIGKHSENREIIRYERA